MLRHALRFQISIVPGTGWNWTASKGVDFGIMDNENRSMNEKYLKSVGAAGER